MITNFLLEHAALVPLAILVVAIACAVLGRFACGPPQVLWPLAALALLAVLGLTLVPAPRSRIGEVTCTLQFSAPTLGSVELLANVALFLPLVFFAALATKKPLPVLYTKHALAQHTHETK